MRFVSSFRTKVWGCVGLCVMLVCLQTVVFAVGTYNVLHEIMDWGPATTKVMMDLGVVVNACPIDNDAFTVYARRVDTRAKVSLLASGYREVTKAYISDARGNKVDQGNYVTLELAYGPDDVLSSPMHYVGTNAWVQYEYTIKQGKDIVSNNVTVSDFMGTTLGDIYIPQIEKFSLDGSMRYADPEYGEIFLRYADYKPPGAYAGSNEPLIIWLHGSEEGGLDASLPITSYKACALAGEEAQSFFDDGAYVLVPQTETYWMDDGSQIPFDERKVNVSKYTNALMRLIETYVAENPGIDRDRIYIGGGSNGGFMTMVMILAYPEYFAAAFPVSEAALDAFIADDELLRIRDMPIWFVHSASDTVVSASRFTLSTYERLIQMGAENIQLSYFPNVVDTSRRFWKADGSPYEYSGHWAWIYLHNNELYTSVDGREVSFLEWLAAQRRAD